MRVSVNSKCKPCQLQLVSTWKYDKSTEFDVTHVDHLILLQAILWSIITHIRQTAKLWVKRKVVLCQQDQMQNSYHDGVGLWSHYCHIKKVCMQTGSYTLHWDLLCSYTCNKLVSITEGNSVPSYLVLLPLLIEEHENPSDSSLCVWWRESKWNLISPKISGVLIQISHSHILVPVIFKKCFLLWFWPGAAVTSQRVPGWDLAIRLFQESQQADLLCWALWVTDRSLTWMQDSLRAYLSVWECFRVHIGYWCRCSYSMQRFLPGFQIPSHQ